MSEKLYALLLRLYPAQFRARYRDEALQLFRDRLRDEPGLFARLRLWFDLLSDLITALPQTHRMPPHAISPAAAASSLPSFSVLEPQSMRPAALVLAWIIGISGLGAFTVLLRYGGTNHASRLAMVEMHALAERRSTSGGLFAESLPIPPTPPFETPGAPDVNAAQPPAILHHRPFRGSRPATSRTDPRLSQPTATPVPISRPPANNLRPNLAQPPAHVIAVPVLGPLSGDTHAIPVPALKRQFGILPAPAHQAPPRPSSAALSTNIGGRGSIVVWNPTQETNPCPATISETGSSSSTKPASSAASAKKSHPCSKSPRSPTVSRNPASPAAPK
jgi:hypothetical protein